MAQLAIAAAASWIGGTAITGTVLGMTGAQLGWMVGSYLGASLMAPDIEGPRVQDLSVQSGQYGVPINVVYGTARVAGNVIWATDLIEHAHEESAKGGPSYTTYSYTVSCAVALCEGEIKGVQKIWANNELIYDVSPENTGNTGKGLYNITVYSGSETQAADPRMQAELGAANVPAHRGLAYVVFEDLPLDKFGNRMPNFNFLVVRAGTESRQAVTKLSTVDARIPVYDHETDIIVRLSVGGTSLEFYHVGSGDDIGSVALPADCEHLAMGDRGTVWAINETGSAYIYQIDGMGLVETVAKPSWLQYGAWVDFNREMVLAQSNIGTAITVFSKASGSWAYRTYSTVSSSNNAWGSVTVTHGTYGYIVLTNGDKICVLDSGYGVVLDYQCSPSAAEYTSSNAYATYDSKRDLVYVTAPNVSKLYVVDVGSRFPSVVAVHGVYAGSSIVYHAQSDLLIGVGTGATPVYKVFAPDDLPSTVDSFTVSSPEAYIVGIPVEVTDMTDAVLVCDTGSVAANGLFKVPFWPRLASSPYPLSDIVRDQCVKAGLTPSDINVVALTDAVPGYVVSRQASARSNIEPLQAAYFFDAVESDDVLKFVKRGGASAATIPEADLGAYEYATSAPAVLDQTRAQETDLPRTVSVNYLNIAADYQQGTQYDRRLTGGANIETTLSLPIAMSDDAGAQIAAVNLYTAWANRNRVKFTSSLKYTRFEPTDVLTVTKGNTAHRLRIVKKDEGGNGLIAWEGVSEDASVYTQGITGAGALAMPTQAVQVPVSTRLELLDIPLLRDIDEGAGAYYAACGYRSGWDGMVLYRSADGGASWAQVATLVDESVIGNATSVLGNFLGGNVIDELNTVTVRLANPSLTLSSTSLTNLLAGANACIIGSEVLGFRDATLNADGSYTLSGLWRGLRGTQWAMSTHAAGDRFVLFSVATTRRIDIGSAEIGLARGYKGVSFYRTLAQTAGHEFTNTAVGLKPYAPAHVGSGRDAAGNITITWVRCTRIGGEWRDYVDASQPEASIEYELEFWTEDGATLVRTVTGLTSETYTYTTALADFPTSSTALLKVYQVSATVGRGYAAEYVIPVFTITEYATDFSEYDVGTQPSDWTAGWNTGNFTALVQESGGVKYLKITNTADARGLLSWDLPGTFADGEIIAKIKAVGRSTTTSVVVMNMVCLRAGGAAGSENNYRFGLDRDLSGSAVAEYVAGVTATVATNAAPTWTLTEWRWMRLQIIGTTIKARTWLDGTAEPDTWLITTTDSSLASGLAGLSLFDSGNDMEVAEVTVRVFT